MSGGVVLLDKAPGITSARAMRCVGRLLNAQKVGHGGTLDPAATGLLVVLLGEATAFASHLLGGDKAYLATIRLGWYSDTDDGDGCLRQVTAALPDDLLASVSALLPSFTGELLQTPPAYSAIKHAGRRSYDIARSGQTPPMKQRCVRIDSIVIRGVWEDSLSLEVRCAAGTYIRSLARDIGTALGCGAYLSALRRLQSSKFCVENAVPLTDIERLEDSQRQALMLPIAELLDFLPALSLTDEVIELLGRGRRCVGAHDDGQWRVYSPSGRFAGIAEVCGGELRPLRFLHWTREDYK